MKSHNFLFIVIGLILIATLFFIVLTQAVLTVTQATVEAAVNALK